MRAAKVDANQNAIVDALRRSGASVFVTSTIGSGFPDLVVGIRGRTLLFECKDGSKPPSARRLTPEQKEFMTAWRGHYVVVKDVDEALTFLMEAVH